ncbi:PIH1 domain-containing protein 1 [Borealophlyctis nickersoniae]|nr:PIH1 domain-containing protein 1 [Borealophlyctis nickersoniae]
MTIDNLLANIGKAKGVSASSGEPSLQDLEAALADPELRQFLEQFEKQLPPGTDLSPEALKQQTANVGPVTEIEPEAGFVVKTHNVTKVEDYPAGLKVFVNVCHSPHVPAPPLASKEEIQRALKAEDNATYRVPLSLNPPRPDRDKAGKACIVFDACINTDPLRKSSDDEDFKIFLIELALQWIEEKYKLELSRDFTLPKMKSKGKLSKHVIRRPKRPFIAEMEQKKSTSVGTTASAGKGLTSGIQPLSLPQPLYEILQEPDTGAPNFLVVQIQLPDVTSINGSTLDIEKDRIILSVPNRYQLDAKLPHPIDTEEGGAQFNKTTRILTATLRVL